MRIDEIIKEESEEQRRHAEISAYLVALGQHGGKLPSEVENAAIQIYMSNKNLETDQAVSIAKAQKNRKNKSSELDRAKQSDNTKYKRPDSIDATRDRIGSDGRELQHDRYYKDDGSDLFPGISGAIKKAGDAVIGSVPGAKELSQYAKKARTAFARGYNTNIPSNRKR